MSDEGNVLTPEHVFKRLIWRSVADSSVALEQLATWFVTGIAAILALLLTHIDSVQKVVSSSGLRWGLGLLSVALLFAVVSRQLGIALSTGLAITRQLEATLQSEQGQKLMSAMQISPRDLVAQMQEPFLWPLSAMMRKAAENGLVDYLSADKRFVKLFCLQAYSFWLQSILAASGMIAMAFSIHK